MGTGRTTEFLTPIRDSERKRVLLRDRRADVLAAMPGAESLLPTIEHAALLVEDDLCLVRPDGVLAAACLCAPSHWVLADKLGRPIADVHRAVPYYRTELARRVDTFLSRLRDGQVVGRRNWSIHETDELFAPVCPPTMGVPPAEQWLRSERQTLSRLPDSGGVLFTIRVDQLQLADVPQATRAALGHRLAAEPDDLVAYRNLTERRPALIEYLTS